jgi:pseudouridine-5'-phosphate glycosidase
MNGLENGVRGIQQGLCDGFYAMNTGMLNGFNGIQSTLCQGFSGVNQGMAQQTFDLSTQLHNMAAASADCCCQTQRAIERGFADTNYNLAT